MEEIEKIENEAIQQMYNVDYKELDEIVEDWEQKRQSKVKIIDVILDQNFLDIKNETQKQMIYDFKCSICYGLGRPPTIMCASCDKMFCEVCIRDVKTNYHKGLLEESLGIRNVSVMDMEAFAEEEAGAGNSIYQLPPINCPLCRETFTDARLPRPIQNQLDDLVFKCCQNCYNEYPDQAMGYQKYIQHLTKECPNIKLACPFACTDKQGRIANFSKYDLKRHLAE